MEMVLSSMRNILAVVWDWVVAWFMVSMLAALGLF